MSVYNDNIQGEGLKLPIFPMSSRKDLPPTHQDKEQQSQHDIANVAEHVVKGCEWIERVSTHKVVVARVLVPRTIQHLKRYTVHKDMQERKLHF